ncbi:MAG: phosphoribosyl 1,2-cyclic phosphodiesterase [Micavibrio sp.]|nr:MAG: phosphoribosyl 1,2-cyclic phosphodiesterase [Micavibrio sp.]
MKAKLTILGCGNSTGVPAIGNYWGDCDPSESKNTRMRSSVLVQTDKTTLVVDTGPDFRQQLNNADVNYIDGVLYTHAHADHINGIDELRFMALKNKMLIPVYGNKETLGKLSARFDYLFEGGNHRLYPQIVEGHGIEASQFGAPQSLGDIEFIPFEQDHGTVQSVGYRFGDLGYSVDIYRLDDKAINVLKGVKIWVVDAAAYKSETNPVHANLETIYELNKQIGAETVYLTSLSLVMDYQTLMAELSEGFVAAHDGLIIEFEC